MKKQILSEELKRMHKLAGLINENDSIDEARWQNDPWADIETGGEHSKSIERRKSSYDRQKENDNLGSATFQYFTNKIKKLGSLMTDEEAISIMDDMRDSLTPDEIMDVYNFLNNNNISSPLYTYLDEYKGETGSYGLGENSGVDVEKIKQPVDLNSVDPHTLEQIKKQLLARNGEMPTDEELRNVVSIMNLEEVQVSEDVMIQEGQLGKAIARILKEEMLKENVDDYEITTDNKIEGRPCVDFNPTELQPNDIIYRKLVDVVNYRSNWYKDKNNIPGINDLSSYSKPEEFKVISNDGKILKLEN